MTLVLAAACTDGALLATDSAITFPMESVMRPEEKAFILLGGMVCAGSGDCGLIQDVVHCLDSFLQEKNVLKKSVFDVRDRLQHICSRVFKKWDENTLAIKGAHPAVQNKPTAGFLFVGWFEDRARIIGIAQNGAVEQHEDRGYAAIGSGAPYAHTALFHHWRKQYDLEVAKMVVWRAMEEAITIAPMGLSYPIHMWQLSKPEGNDAWPKAIKITEAEEKNIRESIEYWRSAELEAFEGLGIIGAQIGPAQSNNNNLPTPDQT